MYPLIENAVSGKRVLIIDDILDTGKSVMNARDHVLQQEPQEVRTAALQYMYSSQIEPDYCREHLEEWAWIVYPWNFIKDMTDIVSVLMERENIDRWDIPRSNMASTNTMRSTLYPLRSHSPAD